MPFLSASIHASRSKRVPHAMTAPIPLVELAKHALEAARRKKLSIVTAESCTAGKLAVLLSEAPGAAEFLQGGFVTYTKANKTKVLGVSSALLRDKGAVCTDVALAMAEGALTRSVGDVAVAITGVAGPDPDEDGNPVGLVCIAVVRQGSSPIHVEKRYGDVGRECVQEQAMADALAYVIGVIDS